MAAKERPYGAGWRVEPAPNINIALSLIEYAGFETTSRGWETFCALACCYAGCVPRLLLRAWTSWYPWQITSPPFPYTSSAISLNPIGSFQGGVFSFAAQAFSVASPPATIDSAVGGAPPSSTLRAGLQGFCPFSVGRLGISCDCQ